MKNRSIDYENFVRTNTGIPYVNFQKYHPSVYKKITQSLINLYSQYPELINALCTIGDKEHIENQYNILINSKDFSNRKTIWEEPVSINSFMSVLGLKFSDKSNYSYFAICLSPPLEYNTLELIEKYLTINIETGYFPKEFKSLDAVLYHEFGHILDYLLQISSSKEFLELIKDKDIASLISKQATSSINEIIPEVFAISLINSNPNKIIKDIFNLVNIKYEEKIKKKSEIFKINKNFK